MYAIAFKRSLATALTALLLPATHAAELVVTVQSIAKPSGQVLVAVYDGEARFRKERTTGAMRRATPGEMQFKFSDLPAGDYAVMVFHDINDNGKLDTNLVGMPKEPWGGSLQGKSVFGAPTWTDVMFPLSADGKTIVVNID